MRSSAAAIMSDVHNRPRASWIGLGAALFFAACRSPSGSSEAEKLAAQPLKLVVSVRSPSFADGAPIPPEFSCEGDDVSPPLTWDGVPEGAVELALVVDDPDAPHGTYVHWVLFGLDPSPRALGEGEVPAGARQSRNSGGDVGYTGPCPPRGDEPHHYRFTVYALRAGIDFDDGATTGEVLSAVRGTAISKGTLTGTFER
jgi:Raf kinase inhibitor-like YbhB/YbcL family protein